MVKKIIILVLGFGCILLGIAMIVLPGPAFIFIPLGIAILSLEFEWAQKLLDKMKAWLRHRRKTKEDTSA